MRIPLLTAPLLASASLAACSSAWKPPEIKYDDTPRQAVLQADPPRPVKIVEVAKPEQVRDQILGKDHASRTEEDDPGHGPVLASAAPVRASKR